MCCTMQLPLLPATSGKHFRHLGLPAKAIYASLVLSRTTPTIQLTLKCHAVATWLVVLNTKDIVATKCRTDDEPYLDCKEKSAQHISLYLCLWVCVCVWGVKNLRIKFPYQQFYLQQFGNTFVWGKRHTSPPPLTLRPLGGDVSISA